MPIFEYRCENCGEKYDHFHKSSLSNKDVICPKCGSEKNKKLFSTFSSAKDGSYSYSSSQSGGSSDAPSSGGCASGLCGLN